MYQLASFSSSPPVNLVLTGQELKVSMVKIATMEVDYTITAAAEFDGTTTAAELEGTMTAAEDTGGSDGDPELAGHIFIYVQQVGSET